jgi:hypothetical protein
MRPTHLRQAELMVARNDRMAFSTWLRQWPHDQHPGLWRGLATRALHHDRLEHMTFLLEGGLETELNVPRRDGSTLLGDAAGRGRTNMVKLLLQYGARPDIGSPTVPGTTRAATPVLSRVIARDPAIARLLLDHCPDKRGVIRELELFGEASMIRDEGMAVAMMEHLKTIGGDFSRAWAAPHAMMQVACTLGKFALAQWFLDQNVPLGEADRTILMKKGSVELRAAFEQRELRQSLSGQHRPARGPGRRL